MESGKIGRSTALFSGEGRAVSSVTSVAVESAGEIGRSTALFTGEGRAVSSVTSGSGWKPGGGLVVGVGAGGGAGTAAALVFLLVKRSSPWPWINRFFAGGGAMM